MPTFVPESKVLTLYSETGTVPKFKHEYLKKRVCWNYYPATTVYKLQVWKLPNRTHLQDQHLPEWTPGVGACLILLSFSLALYYNDILLVSTVSTFKTVDCLRVPLWTKKMVLQYKNFLRILGYWYIKWSQTFGFEYRLCIYRPNKRMDKATILVKNLKTLVCIFPSPMLIWALQWSQCFKIRMAQH